MHVRTYRQCGTRSDADLDMVFQLITFFMMVINFKSAALDMTLKLPVIGSAMPVDTKGEEDVLVMNLAPTGKLSV